MTSQIIRNYFDGFRWSNFKGKVANVAYMIVYFSCILPVVAGFFEKLEYAIVYFAIAIPVLHIVNSGCVHNMRMPKLMYMVPLSQNMKREYIVKSAVFRIVFCTFVGAVCALPIYLMGLCNILTYILIVYNVLTLALLFCGMNERYGIEDDGKWTEIKSTTVRGVVQGVNVFVTIVSSFLMACMLCMDVNLMTKEVPILFAIPAVLIQLPLTIKYMTYWKVAVDRAMTYETSYDK